MIQGNLITFIKREQGYYIQTWHGTPLKKLGMDMDDVFMSGVEDIKTYKCNLYRDTRKWDFLLSQNNFSTEIFKSAFAFNEDISKFKEIWTYGYPRNDVLTTNNNKEDINKLKDELRHSSWIKKYYYMPQHGEIMNFTKEAYINSLQPWILIY